MSDLQRLLAALDPDEHVRGRQWERICRWYLDNDPVYKSQIRRTWLWKSWPDRWGADAGIDLVAELHDGSLMAVQAKAYGQDYWVTKADVDSFLAESARSKFSRRLIIATTNHLGATALRTLHDQKVPAKFLALGDLERAHVDWPVSPDDLLPRRLPPKRPRSHQRSAVDAIERGLATGERGKLVMACGTGKTLVGLWVAERLAAKRTLLLFPSLTLLAQTLREWAGNAARPFEALAVCSDATVYDPDAFVEHTSDLDIRVTTEPKAIRAFLRGAGPRVVFATYQSSPELAKAMQAAKVPAFDLAIADEAHRCAGPLAGEFATILDARAIPAKRRLFMTATPRYFTGRLKREAAASDYEVASMDDAEHFGPLLHELTFGQAIKMGLLADYQVAIVGINNRTYRDYAQRGVFVTVDGKNVTDARTLAGQIGLARAMRKFDLRRTISFHSRIAAARSFSLSVPEVIAWMPARSRPIGTPWSRHISGEMSSGERDTLLSRFRNLETTERGLLANARCLSEGVDVPSIDGVAFVDPRRSQIDIVQAVGRAIRNSPGKKVGTVVLPVFIETTRRPEATLESSAFKPVWDVLRALRAHDAELGWELDALRRGLGRRSAGGLRLPSKIQFDLPVGVDARFAEALRVRIVKATTTLWEEWFALLEDFVHRNGHGRVPKSHKTADGMALGAWVNTQRLARRRGRLSADHRLRLEGVTGWTWAALAQLWDRNFAVLEAFVAQHGHARVRSAYKTAGGMRLGHWVNTQRVARGKGTLGPERSARLESLNGWLWDPYTQDWERNFTLLKAYVVRHRHALVPVNHKTVRGSALGNWVSRQRTDYVRGRLSHDRTQRLEKVTGWTWDQLTMEWETNFALLKAFVEREGHARVPESYKAADGTPFGGWVRNQRVFNRRGSLSPARTARLESLKDWTWDPYTQDWERNFTLLEAFVERHGHARVAQRRTADHGALGVWVSNQRVRKDMLSPERKARLETLTGWTWDGRAQDWESNFRLLEGFVGRRKHARVPANHKTADGTALGRWTIAQRVAQRKGTLIAERSGRLETLPGWIWDARRLEPHLRAPRDLHRERAAWDNNYAFLRAFVEDEGHARVPQDHRTADGTALGAWVSNQRVARRKGTLTTEHGVRLEKLGGWSWDTRADDWESTFALLEAYVERERHARVPASHETQNGTALGRWVVTQRVAGRKNTLRPERRERLEQLKGWVWSVPRATK